MPIPGNKSGCDIRLSSFTWVTQMADGYNFAVEAEEDSEVYLLLYRKRGREPFMSFFWMKKYHARTDFFCLYEKLNVTNLEYNLR